MALRRLSFPRWPLLWPLLVGALSLAATGWLWQHEQQTQGHRLRDNFDFALRQAAARVEQRMNSYAQMLRGARGLFEASDSVSREDFARYVDALLAGADFAGLRAIAYAPLLSADRIEAHLAAQRAAGLAGYGIRPPGLRDWMAPVLYAAPAVGQTLAVLGQDPLADPARRAAMLQARDAGGAAITGPLQSAATPGPGPGPGQQADAIFLMFMPVYAKGFATDTVALRRAHLRGWVVASFRIADMMSSLYGEGTPGLDVRLHDGVEVTGATLMYPASAAAAAPLRPARFEAQEYIGFAGHTWTVSVRSQPEFERQYSSDSPRVIAIAGGGLSLLLALLTWQLVTARERAHAAARAMTRELRDGAQRYRRIVETASEGIWMVDAAGNTSFVNPKMQQLLGYSAAQMLGRPWADFMDAADGVAVDGAGRQPGELRLRRKDGSDLWATLSTSAITAADGSHAGVLAMVTDVTERRLAESRRALLEGQLRQSQKMEAIGTLAGGIAHDFNNILAAILGNVALLRQDLGDTHAADTRLRQIAQAGERARSLVQQIVAFSRQQPQALVVQPLRPLMEETVRLLRATLPARVELETRFSDAPLAVGADATQFQQVLMNLCTNAWHALDGGAGRIVIGLDAAAPDGVPQAHVWVSDNGCGMDEATRQRVFEPFFTTKPVGQGTGLGLAVVHGIVSSHQGSISVHSVPGQGSSFEMLFPLAVPPQAQPAAQPAPAAQPRGGGEHVLYVDDDPVMALMVEALLRRLGYRVSALCDPREALALLRRDPAAIDVLVTDFNMPELSGLDLAREAGALRPALPVVLTSGFVSESLRAEVAAAGVRHVMQKEFTLEQLGGMVQRALAQAPVAAPVIAPVNPL